MTVVSDSSPLITFARIDCFDLLRELYGTVWISEEVYKEVVTDGGVLPGAVQVACATWVEVRPVLNIVGLAEAIARVGLGAGELSSVILAVELSADLVLIDEWRARRYAQSKHLSIIGCVGILEDLYELGILGDLREAYRKLLTHRIRIDLHTLRYSLAKYRLPNL